MAAVSRARSSPSPVRAVVSVPRSRSISQREVRRREDLERFGSTARERFARLDVLVSNAGSMAISGFDALEQDNWDGMVATNLTGVLNGIGAALPAFRQQGSGQFIHMASTSAHRIVPMQGMYAATKTAVRALSEALRQEAGPELRVTVISPGMTNAEGVRGGTAENAPRAAALAHPPAVIARAVANAIEQPSGVDVGEIVVRATAQARHHPPRSGSVSESSGALRGSGRRGRCTQRHRM